MQITYNNMPLLLVGAYDCFVSFHPAVIALTTSETEQEYRQILRLADDAVCGRWALCCGPTSGACGPNE